MNPNPIRFDHQKLKIYQKSLQFIRWVTALLEYRAEPKQG